MSAARCHFLVPGDLQTRTGGYAYDRRIIAGLRKLHWQVEVHALGDGFPAPDESALSQSRRVADALPDGALVVADGLAFGVLPDIAARHARRLHWVALVHHPLSMETGIDLDRQRALLDSERRALACARGVVVTSPSTARALAAFDVPASRIAVVEPGTEPAPLAQGSGGEGLSLLCVATVTPRKGHALLVEALAGLRDLPWTLHCAGSMGVDAACTAALIQTIERHALDGRIVLHGEKDDAGLRSLYAVADLFVLASFHEGYGMVLAEALARGLPVISSLAGAIADTVPENAGLLVPPGDVLALRAALRRAMVDGEWRARSAEGARAARRRLPTWEESAARFAEALSRLHGEPGT